MDSNQANLQYYIILIITLLINDRMIDITSSDSRAILNALDMMIEKNKTIFNQLIDGRASILNAYYNNVQQKIDIKSEKIIVNNNTKTNLKNNFSKLKNIICFKIQAILSDSIAIAAIRNSEADLDEIIRVACNINDKAEFNLKKIISDIKKSSYQDIIFDCIKSLQIFNISLNKNNSDISTIKTLKKINPILSNYSQVASIFPEKMGEDNKENSVNNVQDFNKLFTDQMPEILKNCELKFLWDAIENILNKDLKENKLRKRFQKIIKAFQEKISKINYTEDFNHKVFTQDDEISKDAQNIFNELISLIRKIKYLDNLFNGDKCFGEKKSEINYHSISNKYKNHNHKMYHLLIEFLDNVIKLESIKEKMDLVIKMYSNPIGQIVLSGIDDAYQTLII